jgi:hypothetical protein
MRILSKEVSRFDIFLCQMVYMPLVHLTLANDIKRMEAKFTHEYRPGTLVFHVSICNELGEERSVIDKENSHWSPHWTANPHLGFFYGRMFLIYDENHRFKAWTGYIKRLHKND